MIGADVIAAAIGQPPPTEEQRAVIEAPLQAALVVAGAGSGKTETMANRVLWLLANGHVAPEQMLGLTFTRKAAGELAHRIRERITQLSDAGLLAAPFDDLNPPVVSTYNAFANGIFRENALLLGRESEGALLGEASAWQLARSIVIASDDVRLGSLDRNPDQLATAVLSLSRAVSENIVDPAAIAPFVDEFASQLGELPNGGRGAYAEVDRLIATVSPLPLLAERVLDYDAEKRRRGFIEYSDQVALALRAAETLPQVVSDLRDRHRVVLLDEYQDTSIVQTRLLAALFAGLPVMAVGDPNQSIYGWRGASVSNLELFSQQFADGAAARYSLTTSWRNGSRILAAANRVVRPFADGAVAVDALRPAPTAGDRAIDVAFTETIDEEAAVVAAWLRDRLAEPDHMGQPSSAAILLRTRTQQPRFIAALRELGVPYHVLGIGGLLAEPEITDLVCALRVIHDPAAGSELVRLLAGARWRIGPADLHRLSRVAAWLRDRDLAQQLLPEPVRQGFRQSIADGEHGSLVDALDFVTRAGDGHSLLAGFSETGLPRLREAGALFARLRQRTGGDLLDLVALVEQELMLDIELVANESVEGGRAAMEAFSDALGGYLATDERASLGGFLAWLSEAENRDGLSPRPEDPEPGTVQLLTIHGAKGLEWDAVAVPRLVEGELPGDSPEGSGGWLGFGRLPWPFRGDADDLPAFRWTAATTRKELLDELAQFKDEVSAHQEREERRLAYVAITRARNALLLSGSHWATQTKPRPPSRYLRELEEAQLIGALPEPATDENPMDLSEERLVWPLDPLGGRRRRLEQAAALVGASLGADQGPWERELDLLLEERRRRLAPTRRVPVPDRVAASRFKDYIADADAISDELRRPMPERPYRATRLGTLFHGWVERRYGIAGTVETIDALRHELDTEDAPLDEREFERLREIFERSRWATREPVEVEREIHLVLDGQVFVCKIDAVFADGDDFEIVDWKTGKAPRDAEELEQRQLQLALYRLAYAKWRGIDPERIRASFYYVSDDREIVPERVFDESELIRLWRHAHASIVAG